MNILSKSEIEDLIKETVLSQIYLSYDASGDGITIKLVYRNSDAITNV